MGEAAAEVDHLERDAALGEVPEDGGRGRQGTVPHARVALLRPHVERQAVGDETQAMGVFEHAARHVGRAAELAGQGPFGTRAVAQDAAEHLGAGSCTGDLLDLGLAVDGEERHAVGVGARDVALLLDGVAEGDAIRRRARCQHLLDLDHRGNVEAGAEPRQQIEDLGSRVGLHGIEHPRVGERLGEGGVVVAHDVEVEHHAGAVFGAAAKEVDDTVGHGGIPFGAARRRNC